MRGEGTLLSGAMQRRERLLEAFVLRLAASPEAEAYALRGGMLVRSWLPETGRRVRDVDVVCSLPYRPREMRARLRAVLASQLADGVVFDAERFRVDTAWPHSTQPGLVLFAAGSVDGARGEIKVDLTFQLPVWPQAQRRAVGAATLWTCPHEMVIATKLQVIAELGPREWRAKDVGDLWHVLRRFPVGVLGEAVERRRIDLQSLITASWWRERDAGVRWARYAHQLPSVPLDLDAATSEIRHHLAPLTRRS